MSTLKPPSTAQIRQELESLVVRDLLGPAGGPEEQIDEASVSERYLVGVLAPSKQQADAAEQDSLALGLDEGNQDGIPDTETPKQTALFPSSFGLTFSVEGACPALRVQCRWGRYERVTSDTLVNEKTGNAKMVWQREQVEWTSAAIGLQKGAFTIKPLVDDQSKVYLRGIIRKVHADWIVTLFLVNDQDEPKQLRDRAWLFQPEIIVEAWDKSAAFCQRPFQRDPSRMDPVAYHEERSLEMLYRYQLEFAVGHGVGVHAEVSPQDSQRATQVRTSFLPSYEVPMQTPPSAKEIPGLRDLALDMKELGEARPEELAGKLTPLVETYGAWITEQEGKGSNAGNRLASFDTVAKDALKDCRVALTRIREGIEFLSSNPQAAEAFAFANRAMWLQRVHTIYAGAKRTGAAITLETVDVPANRSWRPFQLAFILLNIPSITDLNHKDRSHKTDAIADLLWFPTGGGKTEAYLGLSAFTLALRRLQGEIEGHAGEYGVGVLMRYTLRLLTLQQFQRASALICACESIRQDAAATGDRRWGMEPFRLGLWVGMKTTPNTTEGSEEAIRHAHGDKPGRGGGGGTPAQLTSCPWCGSAIEAGKHVKVESYKTGRGRTLMYCGDALGQCLFSEKNSPGEGIPVLTVDEEIYRLLPGMVIGTVDKFAQLPWNGMTQMLFGKVNGRCTRHGFRSPDMEDSDSHPAKGSLPKAHTQQWSPLRPPDLIIQDELHLISGPLGSLVGLYETAVDELCSWTVAGQRVRPKVIASTATIRRAKDQVHRLFLRDVRIFPPQGLDVGDNFFSRQRKPEKTPGRLYLGVCAPGRRYKATLIRVYVAFLAAGQTLYEKYGQDADPWMTLVGYFNSMRELGGMRRLVDDDVGTRLKDLAILRRGFRIRKRLLVEELTSRKGSSDIPEILDRLETAFDPEVDKLLVEQRKSKEKIDIPLPYDVLLATNMVSVGVDVKRLGLMVVAGQPKTTAEYIQATSRVGRSAPGIVVTIFNWARPRDLSHYERFEHYHATFYKHVEALSVTPYSARALDRGLDAIFTALIRLSEEDFNPNEAAAHMDRQHAVTRSAIEVIRDRANSIAGNHIVASQIEGTLEARLDHWEAQKRVQGRKLGYKDRKDGRTLGLLQTPQMGSWEPFTCLNSLRDVEPTVGLILDQGEIDQQGD